MCWILSLLLIINQNPNNNKNNNNNNMRLSLHITLVDPYLMLLNPVRSSPEYSVQFLATCTGTVYSPVTYRNVPTSYTRDYGAVFRLEGLLPIGLGIRHDTRLHGEDHATVACLMRYTALSC
jgi:hypothetical protein